MRFNQRTLTFWTYFVKKGSIKSEKSIDLNQTLYSRIKK